MLNHHCLIFFWWFNHHVRKVKSPEDPGGRPLVVSTALGLGHSSWWFWPRLCMAIHPQINTWSTYTINYIIITILKIVMKYSGLLVYLVGAYHNFRVVIQNNHLNNLNGSVHRTQASINNIWYKACPASSFYLSFAFTSLADWLLVWAS